MKLNKLVDEIHSAVCESLGQTVPLSEIEIGYTDIGIDDVCDVQVKMVEGKPTVYVV